MSNASNPKPHVNGRQAPAIGKQERVPAKPGQTAKGNEMPTSQRLPASIRK